MEYSDFFWQGKSEKGCITQLCFIPVIDVKIKYIYKKKKRRRAVDIFRNLCFSNFVLQNISGSFYHIVMFLILNVILSEVKSILIRTHPPPHLPPPPHRHTHTQQIALTLRTLLLSRGSRWPWWRHKEYQTETFSRCCPSAISVSVRKNLVDWSLSFTCTP